MASLEAGVFIDFLYRHPDFPIESLYPKRDIWRAHHSWRAALFAFDYEKLLGVLLAAVICLAALGLSLHAPTQMELQSINKCATVSESAPRLACYDALAIPQHPAKGAAAPLRHHQHSATRS